VKKQGAIGAALVRGLSAMAVYAKKPKKEEAVAAPTTASEIVAYVNDEPIMRDELDKAAASQLVTS
jgi:hypothetical protein